MTKQATKLQPGYATPESNLGKFPTVLLPKIQATALAVRQITRLQSGYAIPGPNIGQFPLAVATPAVPTQITMLATYSMPGQKYVFPTFMPVNVVELVGQSFMSVFWSVQPAGTKTFSLGGVDVNKQFCQQNDVGLQLIYQFLDTNNNPINLVGSSSIIMKIGYPDNIVDGAHSIDRMATFLTDGSDGKIAYLTAPGDLYTYGLYTVQGKYTIGGKSFFGQKVTLQVRSNVDEN
jgi:hypothetical protein